MERERVRIHYSKTGDVRFLSHLDSVRAWERALRRTGIEFGFTDGFNPRLRLSFSGALSTGWESHAEYLECQVAADLSSEELCRRMAAVLPRGLAVRGVERNVTKSDRPKPATVAFAVYRTRAWPPPAAELTQKLQLLAPQMREEVLSCHLSSEVEGRALLAGNDPAEAILDRSREDASAATHTAEMPRQSAEPPAVLYVELRTRGDGGHLRLGDLLREIVEPGPDELPLRILKLAFRSNARKGTHERRTEAGGVTRNAWHECSAVHG